MSKINIKNLFGMHEPAKLTEEERQKKRAEDDELMKRILSTMAVDNAEHFGQITGGGSASAGTSNNVYEYTCTIGDMWYSDGTHTIPDPYGQPIAAPPNGPPLHSGQIQWQPLLGEREKPINAKAIIINNILLRNLLSYKLDQMVGGKQALTLVLEIDELKLAFVDKYLKEDEIPKDAFSKFLKLLNEDEKA